MTGLHKIKAISTGFIMWNLRKDRNYYCLIDTISEEWTTLIFLNIKYIWYIFNVKILIPMNLGANGETLIKHYEKCRLSAYQDSKGVWTIGWGNTRYIDDSPVLKGDVLTQDGADELFLVIVKGFVNDVNKLTKGVVLKQNQFDALVSFAYNVGSDMNNNGIAEGLGDSTLLKLVKANPKDPKIAAEFLKWNTSGGKVLDGLTRRRKSEANLYTNNTLEYYEK